MIEPDTKDWTWVLQRECPDCGFDAATVARGDLGRLVRDNAVTWTQVLTLLDATQRPDPATWSPLEYACHVRDVHRIFEGRLQQMLTEDEPRFANWDQDETAVEQRYDRQDPRAVGAEVVAAADAVAATYDRVRDDQWARRGVRSDGSEFTLESLGRYHLHDLVHHAHDVRGVARATVAAYDASAADYRDGTAALPDHVREQLDALVAAVGAGGQVLEIGSGAGRDAAYLERAGVRVRRTDITPAFVDMMRADGLHADLLDPLSDDLLADEAPAYDAVWANACLLHVARADLPVVLRRLAAATRPGGALGLSLKEGDGEGWSTHGHVAGARRFVLWREGALRRLLTDAGWAVEQLSSMEGLRGERWLAVRAVRAVGP